MFVINGKKIANKILDKLRQEIGERGLKPGLAVILANNDSASQLYVRNKERAAKKAGISFKLYSYKPSNITNELMLARVKKMNKSKQIHGIIVQLPLPKHLDTNKIIVAINPQKDVDGFHPKTCHTSPVALSVMRLIEATKRSLRNKKAVLLVKSEIFAKPIKELLEKRGVDVQIVLFATPSLRAGLFEPEATLPLLKGGGGKVGEADIIITALGKPYILKGKMIKDGAIIIDVGITPISPSVSRSEIGGVSARGARLQRLRRSLCGQGSAFGGRGGFKFVGDFDPRGIKKKKGFYTPVPGGVGPMTVAMLLKNVYETTKLATNYTKLRK